MDVRCKQAGTGWRVMADADVDDVDAGGINSFSLGPSTALDSARLAGAALVALRAAGAAWAA